MGIPLTSQTVAPGYAYTVHPHHRNGTAGKSQWTVTEAQELGIFANSLTQQWLLGGFAWGLYSPGGQVSYLGVSSNNQTRLFVAKFVGGVAPIVWHGYPADPQRSVRDIPEPSIFRKWIDQGVLGLPKIRKLMRGQPCDL